jgi:hypothetical protein
MRAYVLWFTLFIALSWANFFAAVADWGGPYCVLGLVVGGFCLLCAIHVMICVSLEDEE